MRYYYAATFPYGRTVSTGEPNKRTGRMSVACVFHAFHTRKERDAFLVRSTQCCRNAGAFTKKGLRSLSLGSSVQDFEENVRYAETTADNLKEWGM